MKFIDKSWGGVLLIILSVISLDSCFKNSWSDVTQLKNMYTDNQTTFDSLMAWGFTNSRGANPKYLSVDSIPNEQRKIYHRLSLKMILVQPNDCGFNKNGKGYVIFELNKLPTDKNFNYYMFTQDMTTDSRKHIESNGRITQLNNHWYIVQKNYDWLHE